MSMPFIDLKAQYRALKPSIQRRIDRVLEHGQYIMGPEVKELEERLAAFVGTEHCVTVASGTEALLIALMSLGVGPGDEVITTPFTFAATAETIVLLGARPVFVDVDARTCNIDARLIAARLTARTKAIMPVSLYGQPADMDAINAVAMERNIPVIEDAAQSFGATYKGRRSCGLSTIGCTSFFPSKPLGCYGDGGALFTNDAALAQACREIRVHGQSKRYVHTRVGVGGRMDTLQCAILLAKLERFESELQQRQEVAARYMQLLGPLVNSREGASLKLPTVEPSNTSVFAQFTVLVDRRDELQDQLLAEGVPTAVHYPVPLNDQPVYRHLCCNDCTPVSTVLARKVLSLPMGPDLTPEDQDRVVAALRQCLEAAA